MDGLFGLLNRRSLISLLLLLFITPCVSATPTHEFVVVVHKDKQIDSLRASEVKRIFLGKQKRWSDGSSIRVVLNPKDDSHALFSRAMLHKSPNQLETYWRKQLFGGRAMMPQKADNNDDVARYISRDNNSISYLSPQDLNGQLKVLKVVK